MMNTRKARQPMDFVTTAFVFFAPVALLVMCLYASFCA